MNGYDVMAKAYRQAAEDGKMTKEQAEKDCKVLDFLSSCDKDDIYSLFDSGAFNEIAKGYMQRTVKELIADGTINEDQGTAIRNKFALLFSEMTAKDVI